MGRGIAVVFAYAGHGDRRRLQGASVGDLQTLEAEATRRNPLDTGDLSRIDLLPAELVPHDCRSRHDRAWQEAAARSAALRRHLRRRAGSARAEAARRWRDASRLAGEGPIIASTTSTILVDDLAGAVEHPEPLPQCALAQSGLSGAADRIVARELTDAGSDSADEGAAGRHRQGAGVCAARPGFIVPRIQSLAMNEAARMVEEGVASAEDIDKA